MKRLLPNDNVKVPLKRWKKVSDQGDYDVVGDEEIALKMILDATVISIEANERSIKPRGKKYNIGTIFLKLKDGRVLYLSAIDEPSGVIHCDYFEGCDGDLKI